MVSCLEYETYDANTCFRDDLKHLHFYRTFLRAIFPQTSVPRVTKHDLKLAFQVVPGFPKFCIVGSTGIQWNFSTTGIVQKKHHREKHTSKAEANTKNIHVINLFRNTLLKTNSELAPENGPSHAPKGKNPLPIMNIFRCKIAVSFLES